MTSIPTAQGSPLAADTTLAPVIHIDTLRAKVAAGLLERREAYARVTAELTSHEHRGASRAHDRQAALEDTITRLAPDLAAPETWADRDSELIHRPGTAGWCRLCGTEQQAAA